MKHPSEQAAQCAEKLRVLLVCTGIGVMHRGIETFAIECFGALHRREGVDFRLAASRNTQHEKTFKIWSAARDTLGAKVMGAVLRRNSYVAEQLSSFIPVLRVIQEFRPHVVFTSEANLTFQLFRWRRAIGVPFRLLFSNGGPCGPVFPRMDFIHQVTPFYANQALAQGDLESRHIMVPYGISTPPSAPCVTAQERCSLRRRLQLPENRQILLSVGSVDRSHKRMDYLIKEVATLPNRPFLMILGHQNHQSTEILKEGKRYLGEDDFCARSVPYKGVSDYYNAADIFALCSLREGFGRVYLEAAMYGLPVIAHKHPVTQYVLDKVGILGDLSSEGGLATLISKVLTSEYSVESRTRSWEIVHKRFDWSNLADDYVKMFEHCVTTRLPWLDESNTN